MALPSSGEISINDIYQELGNSSGNDISLNDLEDGVHGSINQNSPDKPDGITPNAISEWYGYDHSITTTTTTSPTTTTTTTDKISSTVLFTGRDSTEACNEVSSSTYYYRGTTDNKRASQLVLDGDPIYTDYALTNAASSQWYHTEKESDSYEYDGISEAWIQSSSC